MKWNAHTKKECPHVGTYIHKNEFDKFSFQMEGCCRLSQAVLCEL